MKRLFATLLLGLFYSQALYADLIQYFKDEDGHTNWQYVANFSSSLLILILTSVVIRLFFIDRRLRRTNRALQDIRDALEVRVQERTATLNESNRLLRETNNLLEKEITQHQQTTGKLKRSEAYIKNILESMPLMLIGIAGNGAITQWNRKAEEITGLTTETTLNQNLWQAYPAITVSQRQVEQAIKQNKPLTIKHSQRDSYHFDIIIYPLHGDDETSAVILIDDVTQRIQAENMLIQRDKMSAMGELASTMAYDINAPLQAILQDVDNIQTFLTNTALDNASAETQAHLGRLNALLADASEKGRNASAIIQNLLNFSRTQSTEKQPSDVVAIMENAITLARDVISVPGKLGFRQIAIERDYDDGLSPLPCYPAELQQVFLNLFRHACHALSKVDDPGHPPTINVQIIENFDALWVRIQHNGLGLTLDEQKYIFEPFFNNPSDLDDPSKRLSFSYFIITEHHKGNMAVTSDVDGGSTFHIQFHLD